MALIQILEPLLFTDGDLSDLSLGIIGLLVLAGIIWSLV